MTVKAQDTIAFILTCIIIVSMVFLLKECDDETEYCKQLCLPYSVLVCEKDIICYTETKDVFKRAVQELEKSK